MSAAHRPCSHSETEPGNPSYPRPVAPFVFITNEPGWGGKERVPAEEVWLRGPTCDWSEGTGCHGRSTPVCGKQAQGRVLNLPCSRSAKLCFGSSCLWLMEHSCFQVAAVPQREMTCITTGDPPSGAGWGKQSEFSQGPWILLGLLELKLFKPCLAGSYGFLRVVWLLLNILHVFHVTNYSCNE